MKSDIQNICVNIMQKQFRRAAGTPKFMKIKKNYLILNLIYVIVFPFAEKSSS